MKKNRTKAHSEFLSSTEMKILNMKISTLEYRSWTTDLYSIFCDALFYSKFKECDKNFYKAISGSFFNLLESLNNIPWDIVIGRRTEKPIRPFNGREIFIEDSEENGINFTSFPP